MARTLFEAQPVFREVMERCFAVIDAHLDRPLRDVLYPADGASPIDETPYAQPALFAVAVSLAELWRSWGVAPDGVAGQSQGEIAAAYASGALTLEDAARVVCHRSRLLLR